MPEHDQLSAITHGYHYLHTYADEYWLVHLMASGSALKTCEAVREVQVRQPKIQDQPAVRSSAITGRASRQLMSLATADTAVKRWGTFSGSHDICKSVLSWHGSLVLPEGDDVAGFEGLASVTMFSLMNSIQESSQTAASGTHSTGSTLVKEAKTATAAFWLTAFLKLIR